MNDTLRGENGHDFRFRAGRVQFLHHRLWLTAQASQLRHICETNWAVSWFLWIFSPFDLSRRTGQTGKINNEWEVIGAQVEHKKSEKK